MFLFLFQHNGKSKGMKIFVVFDVFNQRDTNFNKKCICRVPKEKLEEGKVVECVHCGLPRDAQVNVYIFFLCLCYISLDLSFSFCLL